MTHPVAIGLTALLLAFPNARAIAATVALYSFDHPRERDGTWDEVYWYPVGGFPIDPEGVLFDPLRGRLVGITHDFVTFANVDSPSVRHSIRTRNWPGVPVAFAAIYDPRRDRFVMLTLDSLDHMGTFALQLRDSVRWDRLVPFGASPDLAFASAIYDPAADAMVVYGGEDLARGTEGTSQLWSLSLGDHPQWRRLEPFGVAPPPRLMHTAILDPARRAMVVYGGRPALSGDALGDVWSLNLAGRLRWRRIETRGVAPTPRAQHSTVYDRRRARMLVTGGARDSEVWELSLQGPPRWRRLQPRGDAPPMSEGRSFADELRNRLILTDSRQALLWTLNWEDGRDRQSAPPEEPPIVQDPRQSVDVPLKLELASPFWRGSSLAIRASIPTSSEAQLMLFDAGGRRIWALRSEALGRGSHSLSLALPTSAAAGIYFLRLQQDEHSATQKLVRLP